MNALVRGCENLMSKHPLNNRDNKVKVKWQPNANVGAKRFCPALRSKAPWWWSNLTWCLQTLTSRAQSKIANSQRRVTQSSRAYLASLWGRGLGVSTPPFSGSFKSGERNAREDSCVRQGTKAQRWSSCPRSSPHFCSVLSLLAFLMMEYTGRTQVGIYTMYRSTAVGNLNWKVFFLFFFLDNF